MAKKFFVKLIYLISRVFFGLGFLNFLAYCAVTNFKKITKISIFFNRFESLTLSHNNMIALKPVLSAWLEEAEAAKRDPEGGNGVLPPGI